MNKIIGYLTKNYLTVLGMSVLTGLTVTSSASGITKVANTMQVENFKPAMVANVPQVTPPQRQGTTSMDSEKTSESETSQGGNGLSMEVSPSPSSQSDYANRCVVTLFGQQYDVTSLRGPHPGGDVFVCGTDMSTVYKNQHGTNMNKMKRYLLVLGDKPTGAPSLTISPSPFVSPGLVKDDDYDDKDDDKYEEKDEKEEEDHEDKKARVIQFSQGYDTYREGVEEK